ncbi:Uncharacterized protein OBRU01_22558 [Operophtera brumata]|uniref:Dynein heavy chain linker domain-containing protein n=1 Tax=Operophtera brumata TaxID=104452 RepID=A0A0L7KRB7_OPEBR|nr:Uncharacterized protein OBRU01_22558 [Operophtera brumata]
MLGLRAAPRSDTGVSAAELTFGRTLRLPGEYFDSSKRCINDEEYVTRLKETIVKGKSEEIIIAQSGGNVDNQISLHSYALIAIEVVLEFINSDPEKTFEEYCAESVKYVELAKEIPDKLEGTIVIGIIFEEYSTISNTLLTPPLNTAELMGLIAYNTKVEEFLLAEMDDKLRNVLRYITFLGDYTSFTPLEMKANNQSFHWYARMPGVLDESKVICDQKKLEYKELLQVRISEFLKDLDIYEKQCNELQYWGDINELPKYVMRARHLDGKLSKALAKIDQFNEEEASFGYELSQYPKRKAVFDRLVGSFEPEDVECEVSLFYKIVYKLEKASMDEFKVNLPIIQTLGNPGMKPRHWEKISDIVGFPIVVDEDLSLEKVIDFQLVDYIEKDTGSYILSGVDEIQLLLDDHLVKTQTMKNSPYIKPFEDCLGRKIDTLARYPGRVAASASHMDTWREIMKAAFTEPRVLDVITIEKMLDRLKKNNSLLEMVQHGLNAYLEKKRLYFPRFFFLSNDELLEILSETKDPTRVQPHLKKCFEGIAKLNFTTEMVVTHMKSSEGELVQLTTIIDTAAAKGQVSNI